MHSVYWDPAWNLQGSSKLNLSTNQYGQEWLHAALWWRLRWAQMKVFLWNSAQSHGLSADGYSGNHLSGEVGRWGEGPNHPSPGWNAYHLKISSSHNDVAGWYPNHSLEWSTHLFHVGHEIAHRLTQNLFGLVFFRKQWRLKGEECQTYDLDDHNLNELFQFCC